MKQPYIDQFVLVGGTALALQIGHRSSIDLDLFSSIPFSAATLYEQLSEDFQAGEPVVKDRSTLITDIGGVKTDFILFKYPFRLPILELEGIRLLSIEDIAPMKLDAITGRGKKKDFFDLYFLLQRFSLTQMLEWYSIMFQHNTLFHVWKSLTYFEDAESDGEPLIFDKSVDWEKVKNAIRAAVMEL